ncbi:hypothetical protein J1N35_031051 [Gossypium stocksii]|uniref:Zinc finger LSD1-type domain-containing protein n=1 Tax=Gossypium stocksii TaxID=47602 RepID=A0A9D3V3F2_9ROSI|nr:hypothetical protein J1N35_031051 [Gossypium stocksii]
MAQMAQMVCGSCRQLLSYPEGTRQAKCSCCESVNFVLEAHEVGLVRCDSCALLLMYPYGSPSVKCSSCLSVTEIGVNVISSFTCSFILICLDQHVLLRSDCLVNAIFVMRS